LALLKQLAALKDIEHIGDVQDEPIADEDEEEPPPGMWPTF
jgi:hypothetical protein